MAKEFLDEDHADSWHHFSIDRTPERAILRTATRRHNVFVSSCHIRHDVYRPRLHVRASQDKELQAPRKDMFDIPMMDSLEPFRLLWFVAALLSRNRSDDLL
jgi:hypothetical protein